MATRCPPLKKWAEFFGLSPERVAAVRSIMSTPSSRKSSRNKNRATSSSNMKRDRSRTLPKAVAGDRHGMASRKRIESVFLNIPYDKEFEDLYVAYIVA